MRLHFLGAAREVTGSCYLVEAGAVRFLVDCGMFQGGHETRAKNDQAFRFDVRELAFVLLTHAHIDHSGLIPRLHAQGFKGPIYCTPATADLLQVMLPDSAHIQEKEAEWENFRHGKPKRLRRDVAPLYTVAQAQASLRLLKPIAYDTEFTPRPDIRCRFSDAGHILGSAIIELWVTQDNRARKLVFSGDLGQRGHPLVRDPTPIGSTDILVVESTYGNRLHRGMAETLDELVYAIESTLHQRKGNIIVPAFAVGRTQDMLYLLADLSRQGRLAPMDIYVDSPMATSATEILFKHLDVLDSETRALMNWPGREGFFARVRFVEDLEESLALHKVSGALIISASGMCDAGRIKYHLRDNLPPRESSILIIGFQAAGSLGRRLVDGAKMVRIFGDPVPVRAAIHTIGGLSAHADQAGLMEWLSRFSAPPQSTFVVHGEEATALAFAELIRERLGWRADAPIGGDEVILDSWTVAGQASGARSSTARRRRKAWRKSPSRNPALPARQR